VLTEKGRKTKKSAKIRRRWEKTKEKKPSQVLKRKAFPKKRAVDWSQ